MPDLRSDDVTVPKPSGKVTLKVVRCPSCKRILVHNLRGTGEFTKRCRDCKTEARFVFGDRGMESVEIIEQRVDISAKP